MVKRGWGRSIATAIGVAAAVGAAQLGLGYGLGVVNWRPDTNVPPEDAWIMSLTWATWISATSTIVGAIVADRLSGAPVSGAMVNRTRPADRMTSAIWRLVIAAAAALGALVAVALIAVQARVAEPPNTSSPHTIAAGYAVVGILVGLAIAVGALAVRAVAANVIVTSGWLWLLAFAAVADGIVAGRDSALVPLAFWESTASQPWFRNILLPDAGLALGAALVIGSVAALPAARRGDSRGGVVMSGAAGPLTLISAYLLAQPNLIGASAEDLSRHLIVPYLVLAGLVGSLAISAVRPRTREPAVKGPAAVPAQRGKAAEGAEASGAGGRGKLRRSQPNQTGSADQPAGDAVKAR